VCLYSDIGLEQVAYPSESISGKTKQYICSGLDYNTLYYLSVEYDGNSKVSIDVKTGKEVEADQFGIDEGKLCLFYDISINRDYSTGTISVEDITDATTVTTLSTRDISFSVDGKDIESDDETEVGLNNWVLGHEYRLKIVLNGVTYDLGTLDTNPVQNLSYYMPGNKTIHYEATLGPSKVNIFLYLCPEEDEYSEAVNISLNSSGEMDCSDLDDGYYYLYANKEGLMDPTIDAFWSSEAIYLSTDAEVVASQSQDDPTTIIAEVTFNPIAGSAVTIGIYTSSGPSSPVLGPITIPSDTVTKQYEFEGLTLGKTYHVNVIRDGDDVIASMTVTI